MILARLAQSVRMHDWWDYKVSSIVSVFAATALTLGVPAAPLWPAALLLLLAIACEAIFASVINDLTDIQADALAGKPNQLATMGKVWPVVMLVASGTLAACLIWAGVMRSGRSDLAVVLPFAGGWLVFAAYSVPPLRLKARGGWGVIAMGLGEAALPSLFAAMLCSFAAESAAPPAWLAVIAIWAFCHGLRAIIWHQLGDCAADRKAGLDTFVQRRGEAAARHLAVRVILPTEIAALGGLLMMMRSWLPLIALALYGLTLVLRSRFWRQVTVAVMPVPRHVLLFQDYYTAYLPLGVLSALAVRSGGDAVFLGLFIALFPRPVLRNLWQAIKLGHHCVVWLRAAMRGPISR